MPYLNIPKSTFTKGIATMVGKAQGELSNQITKQATKLKDEILSKAEGAITDVALKKMQNIQTGNKNSISRVKKRLDKISKLPKKILGPIKGLEAAINIILILPIPQSVPPGVGLPVSITTRYANILHKLKELVAQAKEDVETIEAITSISDNFLKSLDRIMARFDSAVKSYEIEKALLEGAPEDELRRLGIIDSEGKQLLSSITPFMIGEYSINGDGELTERPLRGRDSQFYSSTGNFEQDIDNTIQILDETVRKVNDSNIDPQIKEDLRQLLNTFVKEEELQSYEVADNFHRAPNGTVYKLEIKTDPDSPPIAQRRFAVALDDENVVVLRGTKSFSSSTQVLLDEIKFRIDNQLS